MIDGHKLSAVVCARNDDYGGFLKERAIISLASMLDTFDEVIYVDWNSEGKNLIEELGDNIPNTGKLKYYIVTPKQHKEFTNNDPDAQKVVEVLARNLGIRRATGDIIVSTNIDVVSPPKEWVERFFKTLYNKDMAYTFARRNVAIKNIGEIDLTTPLKIRDHLVKNMWRMNPKGVEPGWSRVLGCGDFQLATKEQWYKVKGFEEDMMYRMVADSQVQMKMATSKIPVAGLFDYPLFHLDHDMKVSGGGGAKGGKVNRNIQCACIEEETNNKDTWGFSDIEFEEHIK